MAAIRPAIDRLLTSYAFNFLRSQEETIKGDTGAVFASINRGDIERIQIPLPPLEVQQELVAEIEGYQKVIDGARAVIDNYRPNISIHPDWKTVNIGEVVDFISGLTVSIPELESDDGIPIISINNVTEEGNLSVKGLRKITPPKKKLNYAQRGGPSF